MGNQKCAKFFIFVTFEIKITRWVLYPIQNRQFNAPKLNLTEIKGSIVTATEGSIIFMKQDKIVQIPLQCGEKGVTLPLRQYKLCRHANDIHIIWIHIQILFR